MTGSASHASLRRKARLARDEHDARSMSVTRALRLAMEKAADDDLAMPLAAEGLQHRVLDHAALIDAMAQGRLLVLLDGPQGARGAAVLDMALIASLIEAQTMGQVQTRNVSTRAFTRTDAAMAAPLLDCVLSRLAEQLADHPDAGWTSGFRFGAMMEDRRSLGLALSAPDYHVFSLDLDIGPGARKAELLLALPLAGKSTAQADDPAQQRARQAFQGRVLEASVRLEAVLCRMSLPLERISQLRAGDLLPLPVDALRAITLEGPGRQPVATAQLGQRDGSRALRLSFAGMVELDPAQPDSFAPLMAEPEEEMPPPPVTSQTDQWAASQPGEDEEGLLDAADLDRMLFDLDLDAEDSSDATPDDLMMQGFGTGPAAA